MDITPDQDDVSFRARLEQLFALAKEIIAAGFAVLPAAVWARSDGTLAKAPLLLHGHLDATGDPQIVLQWLASPPHVPAGVPADHEVVIGFVPGSGQHGVADCDIKHGSVGLETLKALVREHGNFVTSAWRSPSGGVNVLFSTDTVVGNTSPWPGIDVRSSNGWAVAPGNSTRWGAWVWMGQSSFTSAGPLPTALSEQLKPAEQHDRPATNAETTDFIDASPTETTMSALERFNDELERFRQAAPANRHPAMVRIMSWCWGMEHLDLRFARERIIGVWLDLMTLTGEQVARADEVDIYARWVTAQELKKRQQQIEQEEAPADSLEIYIDWQEFAKRDTTPRRWLVEGFWPYGKAMALWASAKEGKSELVLWCVGKLAMGEDPWTGKSIDPVDIAYFDYEMTEDDLDERLSDFGFDPEALEHLHYALLPPLSPLDIAEGGTELLAHVQRVGAEAVVIDTFTAAVKGEENLADTIRAFTRYTGLVLKRAGIAYLRTDHAGKERVKGPRGSSAKQQDVDVTWNLRRTQTGVFLDCAKGSRLSWVGPTLDVYRRTDPGTGIVSYSRPIRVGWPAGTAEKAKDLDDAGVALDAGRSTAVAGLKAAGLKPGRIEVLSAALRFRREKGQKGQDFSGTANGNNATDPLFPRSGNSPGNSPPDLFSDQP